VKSKVCGADKKFESTSITCLSLLFQFWEYVSDDEITDSEISEVQGKRSRKKLKKLYEEFNY